MAITDTERDYLEEQKQLTESVTEPDEKQSLWLITDKGKKYIENPPVLSGSPLGLTLEPTLEPTLRPTLKNPPAEWFISLAETPSGTPSGTPSRTPLGPQPPPTPPATPEEARKP